MEYINSSLFTRFGRDLRAGKFEHLHPDSLEYVGLWNEQLDYCVNGITIGGRYMPGRLYFYVNFGTIEKIDKEKWNGTGIGTKVRGLPDLRDVEWEMYRYKEIAQLEKKNLFILTCRRLGKSYTAANDLAYGFIFQDSFKGVCSAGDSKKSRDLMDKVRAHLNGLIGTQFYIPILKDRVEDFLQSGWKVKDNQGNWITRLDDRFIYNRNFGTNHMAANGLTSNLFIFEEVGAWGNVPLTECFASAQPCWKEGMVNYGMAVLQGTGGDMDKGTFYAAKIFEDPESYDILPFELDNGKKIGYFIPGYKGLNEHKNESGYTDIPEALESILEAREKLSRAKDFDALASHIQNYPLTYKDAFIRTNANIFPIGLLQNQIEFLLLNPYPPYIGEIGYLKGVNNTLEFVIDETLKEVEFPTKSTELKGCITIYEHPFKVNGVIPYGLYIAGTDPYAQDVATTSPSLGSTFIYKRFYNAANTYDMIVAEYTGRPSTIDEYHENVRKLLMYYNARVLYENNIPGLKQYFEIKNCLYLLQPQPGIIKDIVTNTLVDRKYGIHMTDKIKLYLLNEVKNWLLQETDEGKYNLEKIYSINLLKELIDYNDEDNFDRVIAFGLCILQDREMYNLEVAEQESKKDAMFDNFFSKRGFNSKRMNGVEVKTISDFFRR